MRQRIWVSLFAVCFSCLPFSSPSADQINIILFRGFLASSGDRSGMDILAGDLRERFGGQVRTGVFNHFQGGAALESLRAGDMDRCCLVVIGHSFGGDAVIEFAHRISSTHIDLTVQIDTVGAFDDELPANVDLGPDFFKWRRVLESCPVSKMCKVR